ncbi:hypothetical protein Trydic_g6003 [Trypoxylus dichotomus]
MAGPCNWWKAVVSSQSTWSRNLEIRYHMKKNRWNPEKSLVKCFSKDNKERIFCNDLRWEIKKRNYYKNAQRREAWIQPGETGPSQPKGNIYSDKVYALYLVGYERRYTLHYKLFLNLLELLLAMSTDDNTLEARCLR